MLYRILCYLVVCAERRPPSIIPPLFPALPEGKNVQDEPSELIGGKSRPVCANLLLYGYRTIDRIVRQKEPGKDECRGSYRCHEG
jgi:hypothetical protein